MAVLAGAKYFESNKGLFKTYGTTVPTTQDTMPDGNAIPNGSEYTYNGSDGSVLYIKGAGSWSPATANPNAGTGYSDILTVADFASLPVTGTANILYITDDDNLLWYWTGTGYVEASPSSGVSITGNYTPNVGGAPTPNQCCFVRTGNNIRVSGIFNFNVVAGGELTTSVTTPFPVIANYRGGVICGSKTGTSDTVTGYIVAGSGGITINMRLVFASAGTYTGSMEFTCTAA